MNRIELPDQNPSSQLAVAGEQGNKKSPFIVVKIPRHWLYYFEGERAETGLSLSYQVRYDLNVVFSTMQKPLSVEDIQRIKTSIDEIKVTKGGRNVVRDLKTINIFLGRVTTEELRQIAKDNHFSLSDLLRGLLGLYLKRIIASNEQ